MSCCLDVFQLRSYIFKVLKIPNTHSNIKDNSACIGIWDFRRATDLGTLIKLVDCLQ